jgi:hypothetical protein
MDEDFVAKPSKDDLLKFASEICDSEAMMWLCSGSNHFDIWMDQLKLMYFEYRKRGGGYGNK